MRIGTWALSVALLTTCGTVEAAQTLQVGPGRPFARPSLAIAAAQDGDTIEIDAAGNYDGDVCVIRVNGLTLRGVGNGRARIRAAGRHARGKGIWVIAGNNIIVDNIEFSGARVPDRNGAGIRAQGANLTIRNCRFHDCQDAILGGAGIVLIEFSEFSHCGLSRQPVTHNLYMSRRVDRLIYRFNYSHHTTIGHLLKSRAKENFILYNRLTDEDGTGSYVINLPNGGRSYIIGNVLQKGRRGSNHTIIAYGEEGSVWPNSELYVINNTMINDYPRGRPYFIRVRRVPDNFRMVVRNNIFAGRGTVNNWATAVMAGNFSGGDPMFVNRAGFDLRLRKGSPCIDAGVDPGKTVRTIKAGHAGALERIPLRPLFQYVHPHARESRPSRGRIDIGAYEFSAGPKQQPPGAKR